MLLDDGLEKAPVQIIQAILVDRQEIEGLADDFVVYVFFTLHLGKVTGAAEQLEGDAGGFPGTAGERCSGGMTDGDVQFFGGVFDDLG